MMNSIETTSWRTFPLVDVFEMSNTKSIVQRDIIPDSGTTPYVTASEKNNGVLTYISCPPEWLDKGGCIMIGGKTLTFTYQEQNFCSNDSHNIALYVKGRSRSASVYTCSSSRRSGHHCVRNTPGRTRSR